MAGLAGCVCAFWAKKNNMIKRLFDIVFSFFALIIGLPLIIFFAILIKLDSPGSVFYQSERIGRRGKPFKLYKFRTMVPNVKEMGPSSTSKDDSRLTKIGRIIRRYKLDEIPQCLNILRGEMSVVGPRPQVFWAVKLYTKEEKSILNVRPGMIDWATLSDFQEEEVLSGSTDPDKDYMDKIHPRKMELGLKYVRNHSFLIDLKIILKGFKTLFKTILTKD